MPSWLAVVVVVAVVVVAVGVVVGVDEWWRQGARGGRVAFPVGIVAVGWGGTCSLVGAWGIVLALVRMPHLCICI